MIKSANPTYPRSLFPYSAKTQSIQSIFASICLFQTPPESIRKAFWRSETFFIESVSVMTEDILPMTSKLFPTRQSAFLIESVKRVYLKALSSRFSSAGDILQKIIPISSMLSTNLSIEFSLHKIAISIKFSLKREFLRCKLFFYTDLNPF